MGGKDKNKQLSLVDTFVRYEECSVVIKSPSAYAPFMCSALGYTLALLTNIRLGWSGLPGTTTVTDYKHS